jgi:hypothetical protein
MSSSMLNAVRNSMFLISLKFSIMNVSLQNVIVRVQNVKKQFAMLNKRNQITKLNAMINDVKYMVVLNVLLSANIPI